MGIVAEMGYVPNLLAKSLGSKKIRTLAVLLPVSDSDHAYWHMPLEGIKTAASELVDYNTDVHISQFDPAKEASFTKLFDEILDSEPEGIIVTPVFETVSLIYAKKCKDLGIPLICLEINLDSEDVLGYFGQDANGSGNLSGKLMEQLLPENSSILLLNLARKMTLTAHLRKRTKGFVNYFVAPVFKKKIEINSINLNVSDEEKLLNIVDDSLRKDPSIKGIFVTNSQVYRVAKILAEIERVDILLVGYDLLDVNLAYLERGIIDFLIGHKPEEHGYRSVMALFNYINGIGKVERVNLSPIDIIMKENVSYYKNKKTFIR